MKIESDISEYLHALSTLRLAEALDNNPKYVRAVAQRLAKRIKAKEARKICRHISKHTTPGYVIDKFLDEIARAYNVQGYNWMEQA